MERRWNVRDCASRRMDFGDVARPSGWCLGAPVPRSPRGARTPSTIDRRATGPPVHTTRARRAVRFGARRDAAHRGPLEASVTDIRTDFGADEGSARKIPDGSHEPSNHDLSASSRNASRRDSSFAHRHPSIASRRTREAIGSFPGKARRAPRTSVGDAARGGVDGEGRRTAGDHRRSLQGLRARSLAFLGAEPCGWLLVTRGVRQ